MFWLRAVILYCRAASAHRHLINSSSIGNSSRSSICSMQAQRASNSGSIHEQEQQRLLYQQQDSGGCLSTKTVEAAEAAGAADTLARSSRTSNSGSSSTRSRWSLRLQQQHWKWHSSSRPLFNKDYLRTRFQIIVLYLSFDAPSCFHFAGYVTLLGWHRLSHKYITSVW